MRLAHKIAWIAGCGKRMGRATALLFAQEGAKVVVTARTETKGQETCQMIRGMGGQAISIAADLNDRQQVQETVQEIQNTFGGLDVMFHGAGGYFRRDAGILHQQEDFWQEVLQNHLLSLLLCVQQAVPAMAARGGGSIVTVAASQSTRLDGKVIYGVAKDGVIGATRSLARELYPQGIRVNAVAPDYVSTEIQSGPIAPVQAPSLHRHGQPEDVAYAALYFACAESSWVTGQVLSIDGGQDVRASEPYRPYV